MSKTKLKWLSRIMTSLGLLSSIYSFFILGAIMAKVERTITDETWLLVALGIFIFYFFSIYFTLLLHELGHAFFGKLSGYQMVALGIGNWHLIRQKTGWKFEKKAVVPGAAAQYIGIKKDRDDIRGILMFSGGLLTHLLLLLVAVLVGWIWNIWDWASLYIFLNLGLILINASPDGITDGAKLLELYLFPENGRYLQLALKHAAILYTAPDTATMTDFYSEEVPLQMGSIPQTFYLNHTWIDIFEGRFEKADADLQTLANFTENSFIKMCASYSRFEAQLLSGNSNKARELAKTKAVKKMLAHPQASIQTIKAKYELEVLGNKKKAQKSLKIAKKAFKLNQLLKDEKAFYSKIYEEIKEKV